MSHDPIICQFDQTKHADVAALHAHLRKWRCKQETYYHQYYPRRDRLTGDLIPFKDRDQYLSQEFATKVTLKRWLKENPKEGLVWAVEWLKRRRDDRGLTYAPSQVELRTMMCPSMPYYDTVGSEMGGYLGITASLGFVPRYTDTAPRFAPLAGTAGAVQDTREQKPIKLEIATAVGTLDIGDYALAAPHDQGTRIERKSLNDFCGTLSGKTVTLKSGDKDSALERFDRELARAVSANLYVVMMVESDINEAQSFNYLPHMKHVKASPSYLMHNLRSLLVKYPLHFQALFVAGRAEMAAKMMRVFSLGDSVRRIDLQYAYERGLL